MKESLYWYDEASGGIRITLVGGEDECRGKLNVVAYFNSYVAVPFPSDQSL
jgi:hypothetical protein